MFSNKAHINEDLGSSYGEAEEDDDDLSRHVDNMSYGMSQKSDKKSTSTSPKKVQFDESDTSQN